jgi:uridine phosphorylase
MTGHTPLLNHPLNSPTAFSPLALVNAVRTERQLDALPIPEVCILEFDGDLTDFLVSARRAKVCKSWACFHTTMYSYEVDGIECGIVPRTIGGPYAVLIAEQMAVSGAKVVVGLTSAGRVSRRMPVPGLVVATRAIRDEGTSLHYLPPAAAVNGPRPIARYLLKGLEGLTIPVRAGTVWTTDAPYRETAEQVAGHSKAGALAVEMQAASLFAFSRARHFTAGLVAHVTNGLGDEPSKEFDKGSRELQVEILRRICVAGERYLSSTKGQNPV